MKKYLAIVCILLFFSHTLSQSIDYETQIQPIFDNSCMPCHSGNNPSGGLNLTSYENVMAGGNGGDVISIGDYENSSLWQEVSSGDMPNNTANGPLGIPDLNNEEVELIQNWILDLACMVIDCMEGYECVLGECVCISDADGDEICDVNDNCPEVFNPDQLDTDNDGIGNDCDPMPLSIDENYNTKKIIKVIDLAGKSTQSKQQTLIYIYKDGTSKKIKHLK